MRIGSDNDQRTIELRSAVDSDNPAGVLFLSYQSLIWEILIGQNRQQLQGPCVSQRYIGWQRFSSNALPAGGLILQLPYFPGIE